MQLQKIMTLSTAHIKPSTAELLDKLADPNLHYPDVPEPDGIIVYSKDTYGWFLYICEDGVEAELEAFGNDKIPKDLSDCISFAFAHECSMLCFDQGEGELSSDVLPVYFDAWADAEKQSAKKQEPTDVIGNIAPTVSFEDVEAFASKYGFKAKCQGGHQCIATRWSISAQNTDGEWTEWFFYNVDFRFVYVRGNTDNLNLWLHETRPDMTAERCIQMVDDLNKLFQGDCVRFAVSSLIDPEDWQEIAGIQDAYEDPRYTSNS